MHTEIEPAIQYWGTPVCLVSTLNQDHTVNVAPMSSVWWLGWSAMLGLDASSKTVENLARDRNCVLNLPSADLAPAVNRLARTTGSPDVPVHKKLLDYRYVADKLTTARLTTTPSVMVAAPRITECPVQLEAEVVALRPFAKSDARMPIAACSVELQIRKVHVEASLVVGDDRVDADQWRPLFMSFRRLFDRGVALEPSRLNHGAESLYAPWKQGPIMRTAGRALRAWSNARYQRRELSDDA